LPSVGGTSSAIAAMPPAERLELDRPKGAVLLGVQGGGKSLVARALAGEWNESQ
jgi:ATP-dependent 26S proteasome regulatory subunit